MVVLDNLIYGHKEIVENILKAPLIIGDIGNKKTHKTNLKWATPKNKWRKNNGHNTFAAYAYVGESVIDPLKYYLNNVQKSISFFEVILEEGYKRKNKNIEKTIPIVFSSTCATYGIPSKLPIDESMEQNPINPYGKK